MSILSRLGKQALAIAVSISLLSAGPSYAVVRAPVYKGTVARTVVPGAVGAARMAPVTLSQINVNLNGALNTGTLSAPNAPQLAPAAETASILRVNAAQAEGPIGGVVERHPVLGIISQLQNAGINVNEMPRTASEVDALKTAIEKNVPEGGAKKSMLAFAHTLGLSNGAASKGDLDRIWDNVSGAYKGEALMPSAQLDIAEPQVSGWTKYWAGAKRNWFGLKAAAQTKVKAAKEKAIEDAYAKAQTVDLSKFAVPQSKLRYVPEDAILPESTQDVDFHGDKIFGQDRGMESLDYAIRKEGTHVILTGADGTGRITAVRQVTNEVAPTRPTPKDIVSATNFGDREKPVIMRLGAGNGVPFKKSLMQIIGALKQTLPKVLSSGEIAGKKKEMHDAYEQEAAQRQEAFNEQVSTIKSGRYGIALMQADEEGTAFSVVITVDEKVLDGKEMEALIAEEAASDKTDKVTQEGIKAAMNEMRPQIEAISGELQAMMQELGAQHNQVHQQMSQLDQQAVGGMMNQFAGPLMALTEDEAMIAFRGRMQERRAKIDAEMAKVKILDLFGLEIMDHGDGRLAAFPTFADPRAAQLGEMAAMLGMGAIPIQGPEAFEALKSQVEGIPADLTWEALAEATMAKAQNFEGAFTEMHKQNAEDHKTLPAASQDAQQAGAYVKALLNHMAKNYEDFLPQQMPQGVDPMMAAMMASQHEDPAEAYKVSVLATNQPDSGAPVVFEPSPSFKRVFGTAEDAKQIMMMGGQAVRKDAPGGPKLKSGALIRANGGYLVMDVMDVLREPGVYQGLMRMLRNGTAEIGENGIMSIYQETDKYDVPIDVKIVLVGSPYIKMMLRHHDEDFSRMFKSAAEFQDSMKVSQGAIDGYLKFMRKMVEISGGKMLHFARSGIAAMIEAAARGADSNEELTARFGPVNELMSESSYWAQKRIKDAGETEGQVTREDVEKASRERLEREGSMKDRLYNLYAEGSFKLDVEGEKVGAITGMAVMGQFGIPAKITVRRSLNRGGEPLLVSTERNAQLTGSSFEQSVGNITGFFEQIFGEMSSWPLKARVKFEQNYGGIDGDSATQTMIYAILSSWADVPLRQGVSITGSTDQEGNVQVIGGLKHKIEGTWDVTVAKFRQDHGREPRAEDNLGIMFPADNIRQLALRPDVAKAVEDGILNLYPVTHVSQGVEILTGQPYAVVLDKARANAAKSRLAALAAMKEAKEAMGE